MALKDRVTALEESQTLTINILRDIVSVLDRMDGRLARMECLLERVVQNTGGNPS